ncbi:helix-turn-helix domain-containing protein [Lacrimispora sp.]|uniref:helix-turn-helix domain-containing protein n=1 Tax=Lacrimispora sp. TaxID=2719234 RepID=UPI0028AD1820|nr:helix-turn-helix transcriptional regulator [Lacrimispora sp.]
MDYLRILGENVRIRRINLGYTQEQLAEKADLHRTYIGAIERGDRNVSLNNIVAIANALKVKPHELLIFPDNIKEKR